MSRIKRHKDTVGAAKMLVKSSRDNELLALDTSSVLLDNTSVGEGSPVAYMTSSVPVVPGAICATPVHSDGETRHGRPRSPINAAVLGAAGEDDGQEPEMKAPHVSTLYEKQAVMAKHFGVTQEQALRTQALLRLGVTDEDVRIAERLMAARSSGDTVSRLSLPRNYEYYSGLRRGVSNRP